MSKRPFIYLLVGMACAVAAVLAARKYLVSRPAEAQMPLTKVLVASKDIEFGSRLVLMGEGEEGNVGFATWPVKYVPEGAITSAEAMEGKSWVALTKFVRYQTILQSQIVTEDEFIPPDMDFEGIDVDAKDLALIRPGDRIDILRITSRNEVEPFILCARVCSVGAPPQVQRPGSASSARGTGHRVYILYPVRYRETVVEANLKYKLMVRRSAHACEEKGFELVGEAQSLRAREAEQALQVGDRLVETGQYRAALEAFEKVVAEYADLPVAETAEQKLLECKKLLSARLLDEARMSLERKDFRRCIELCDSIAKDYPDAEEAVAKAEALAQRAREAQSAYEQETRYRDLHEKIQQALKRGDIPLAGELLGRFKTEFEGYEAPPSLKSPAEVIEQMTAELTELERSFEKDRQVLVFFLNENRRDRALEKFEEIKKRYPDHPYIQEAQRQLQDKGWLD